MKNRALLLLALAVVCTLLAFLWLHRLPFDQAPSSPAENAAVAPSSNREMTTLTNSTVSAIAAKEGALTDFAAWLERFHVAASPDERLALTAEGLRLARVRRRAMEALIVRDPQEALRRAVPLDVYESLPSEMRTEVEEPFSALGDIRVLPVCATPGAGRPEIDAVRLTQISGREAAQSYVFGRRVALDTKENSPLQGIRLGTVAALRTEVFQPLGTPEIAAAEAKYPTGNPQRDRCFATGHSLGAETVVALSGGRVFRFENAAVLAEFDHRIASLDTQPGPHSGASVLFLPMPATPGGGFDLEAALAQSQSLASSWTETKKRVFIIRADFSDCPDPAYPVVGAAAYATLLNTTISDRIRDFSYGKTWIEAGVSDQVIRLPRTAASYAADLGGGNSDTASLLNDARIAYRALNGPASLDGYDIVGVWFVMIGMTSSGVTYGGTAGGSDLWIQGNSDAAVLVHELGHNYGVGHSSFWVPPALSTNPLDPGGTNDEYGDPFDVMGKGPLPDAHFNAEAKQRLNWLASGSWADATAGGSGTYRIHRLDHPSTAGVRAVRVTRGADSYLWIGHRRSFANSWLQAGAYLVWKRPGWGRSWFLDFTPGSLPSGSIPDRTDGALAIGRTFAEPAAQIYITPVGRGGTSPNEYLDVRVNLGPFPANQSPTATIAGPATVGARQTVVFTTQASDPEGDALAYAWDFGSGFTFENHPSAATAWQLGGSFTVKLTVSDMKGGSTTVTKSVTVTDPLTTWTDRANSSVGTFQALAASPSTVLVVGEDFSTFLGPAATSLDGVTWTDGSLGAGRHGFAATWDGTQFIVAGMEYDFAIPAYVGCILTSPTGITWTPRLSTGPRLNGVVSGGGVRVAVGEGGRIWRSTDGSTWTQIASGTVKHFQGVAFGGGRFIATGYDTVGYGKVAVFTSSDGLSWIDTSSGAGVESWQDLRKTVWAKDRFLSSGWYSKLRHSLDLGVSFQTNLINTVETPAMAFGNGVYFAAGQDRNASDAHVDLVSLDGANWLQFSSGATDERRAALFFQNTFITAGANHSIRQTGVLPPATAGYVIWREAYFPDHGSASTAGGDPDFDSLPNLFEYGAGIDPLAITGVNGAATAPVLVRVTTNPNLADRIALQFSLPEPAAADLVYTVEAAASLTGGWATIATKTGAGVWIWNGGGTTRIVIAPPGGGRQQVTVGDSQPIVLGSPRFLRLRVAVDQPAN
jgi:PKD repeat protein